jgi:hypothetical protein|tara:strand:- start:489 stop:797 length:309 start_codon:yes stop_codon:yes gene_type:complete
MQDEDDLYRPLFDPQQLTKLWERKKFKKTTNIKTKIARSNRVVKEFDAKKAAAEKLEEIKNKKAGKLFAEARAIDERIKKTDVPSYEDLKRFHNLSKDIEDL